MTDLTLEVPKSKYHKGITDGFKLLYPHGCKRKCTNCINLTDITPNKVIDINNISLAEWLKIQGK